MKMNTTLILAVPALAVATSLAASYEPSAATPPKPPREFRAAWVATVANIDWPSKRGLPAAEQKAELISILDRAAALKLNAVIFQVRPACDAMYASQIEPWSEFLTGAMGQPPQPFYDPLALAVEEAHKRGLELHAWFNPYRALHPSGKGAISATHVSKTRPQIVRTVGKHLWLDPGEKETQDYSVNVVMDVVKRYDVDGVHFDDYFYPYRSYADPGPDGKRPDFPDDASWKKFGAATKLSRDDWRRQNVDVFVRRVYESVKAAKPWVKCSVSPFGIWRPGYPAQIKGMDPYVELYADSRKWLLNGWVDYFTPQLYWAIEPKDQSFTALLDWWNQQNPKKRHIWPGMNTTKVGTWGTAEIIQQITLSAKQPVSAGHVHWNMKSLLRSGDLQSALQRGPYAETALVPASPWLDAKSPAKPTLAIAGNATELQASWSAAPGEPIGFWLLQVKRGGNWASETTSERSRTLAGPAPEMVAVAAIDRAGNASPPAVLQLKR
jgi:uncharacterized lipoprotein YddW (UPF0748 family)